MKKVFTSLLLVTIFYATLLTSAQAVNQDEFLDNPVLEARAREISTELRCVVCQNQSIDDSDADIARDLRLLVRERLVAGDNDDQVVSYIVARYGDFVLLRPPWQPNTYMLWTGPPIMAVVIAMLSILFLRTHKIRRAVGLNPAPLSPNDRDELNSLVQRIAAPSSPLLGQKNRHSAELAKGLPPAAGRPEETEPKASTTEQGNSSS